MQNPSPSSVNRVGIHYFPDTLHYRLQDLETWLPEMLRIGASWTTLLAPAERAIPEYFLKGLLSANIEPVLHFQLPTNQIPNRESFRLLFSNYARWGIRHVALFDRPNLRVNWHSSSWAQTDLVERFLDHFLPLAEVALLEGLTPVFPPLEPGGDYWDLSFLRSALRSIRRRTGDRFINKMVLGAYAFTGKNPIDWGFGGPERWSGVHPYFTPKGTQDHLGFRIFDWYLAVSEQELDRRLPIILLRAGSLPEDYIGIHNSLMDGIKHAEVNLSLARLLNGEMDQSSEKEPIPPQVLACNFWLLVAQEQNIYEGQAWFQSGNVEMPVVDAFHQWISSRYKKSTKYDATSSSAVEPMKTMEDVGPEVEELLEESVVFSGIDPKPSDEVVPPAKSPYDLEKKSDLNVPKTLGKKTGSDSHSNQHIISHYVLLPLYSWGAANWDLALIQPILEESHPTVGFSLEEARLATRVTVVGGEGAISSEALGMLRASGCHVERLQEDGMLIAT